MEFGDLVERLLNRLTAVFSLLALMLYIHLRIIPIHPLMFIVWPLSLWLSIEVFVRFKDQNYKIIAFVVSFITHASITGQLVVYRLEGIFFDFQPVHNLSTISYIVLVEVILIFLYDALIARSLIFKEIPAYIGFASVIPWLSPAFVETLILVRWSLKGTFPLMTAGKSIGGAHLNDILFYYGSRNFVILSALFGASMLVFLGSKRLTQLQEANNMKRIREAKDKEWLTKTWKHPLTLLSIEERELFLVDHGHLGIEQQNDVLRREVLPAKGIYLIDPGTFS